MLCRAGFIGFLMLIASVDGKCTKQWIEKLLTEPRTCRIPGLEQPFGYTGYRHDGISGTYFAQAREYRPGDGQVVGSLTDYWEFLLILGEI